MTRVHIVIKSESVVPFLIAFLITRWIARSFDPLARSLARSLDPLARCGRRYEEIKFLGNVSRCADKGRREGRT